MAQSKAIAVDEASTAEGQAIAESAFAINIAPQATPGSVVDSILQAATRKQLVSIVQSGETVAVRAVAAAAGADVAALMNTQSMTKRVAITPDEDKRSSPHTAAITGTPTALETAVDAVVDPVKPSRNVASLVNAVFDKASDENGNLQGAIFVDQESGKVFYSSQGDLESAAAVVDNGADADPDTLILTLESPEVPGAAERFAFE